MTSVYAPFVKACGRAFAASDLNPHTAGGRANDQGKPKSDNPHEAGSDEREWDKGWQQAEDRKYRE